VIVPDDLSANHYRVDGGPVHAVIVGISYLLLALL
jgi:hypothetical protein